MSPNPAFEISVSRGLGDWLLANNTSFAFTSYQTGQLFMVGVLPNGKLSLNQQNFTRAMGVSEQGGRLYLVSLFQIWRLENMLRPGELGNGSFDAVYVPRNAQTTGDVDAHELGVDREGRVVFVNTKYSCLATLDLKHSFRPIWKPPFISKLAAEDRCHLNGMAMADGRPKYVTAISRTDLLTGWRARRDKGGVVIDVETDRIVTDQLSMPHSPRLSGGSRPARLIQPTTLPVAGSMRAMTSVPHTLANNSPSTISSSFNSGIGLPSAVTWMRRCSFSVFGSRMWMVGEPSLI